ncbi:MAG TPA: hypothetical protein ENF33_04485 [Nitrososphaeria archaeon]|nr:hypothetical protein [Nitrososphaeria archaeon]
MKKSLVDFLKRSGLRIPDLKLLDELLKESHLTRPQIETLLIELGAANLGLKLSVEEKARLRGVSKGAYARTKRQAIDNIRRSIYTLMLLRFLGILGDESLTSILEASELLIGGRFDEAVTILRSMTLCDVTR